MNKELKELKAKIQKAAEIHNDPKDPYCHGCPYQNDPDCYESISADFRRAFILEAEEADEAEDES